MFQKKGPPMNSRPHIFSAVAILAAAAFAHSQSAPATPAATPAPAVVVVPTEAPPSPNAAPPGAATQPANTHPEFDVATVKPAATPDFQRMAADMQAGKTPRFGPHVDTARAEFIYMSLKDLIVYAYSVKPYQIDGPSWLGDQRFDIQATIPDGIAKDQAPAMLQNLLAQRFKLTVHRDKEEHKVLALVVGKGGPKLKESPAPAPVDDNAPLKPDETKIATEEGTIKMTRKPDGTMVMDMGKRGTMTMKLDMSTQSMHLDSSMVTLDGFADMLTNLMQMGGAGGPQVVNMTALKGNYQVALDLSLADVMAMARAQGVNTAGPMGAGGGTQANAPANAASDPQGAGQGVYSSVEQMGLKLEERKATVDRLIVDHAEKAPAPD
jgi:uncharacterized protein (TIGR03435 family)